ncbi:MAG: four helix bundle protein [Candidatus Cloacimonas sp.]|jgi:four helix bundle protein|nr:four helix bundle protein [Candidatus Cloacimonas sp.]
MKTYRDLDIWKKGMHLAANVYELAKELPEEEKFGLAQDIAQTAVSITSNIANGAETENDKEYKIFMDIVSGKLARLEAQIEIAKRLGYLNEDKTNNVFKQINLIRSQLSGLKKDLKTDAVTN